MVSGDDADDGEIIYTATWQKNPVKPNAPTNNEVYNQIGNVIVKCEPGRHGDSKFDCIINKSGANHTDRIIIGEVQGNDQAGYTCTVTFLAEKYADAYSALKSKTHTLVEGEGDKTVGFQWNASTKKWETKGFNGPVTFWVECDEPAPTPVLALEVAKTNGGFQLDQETGNAYVNYTVTVKNSSNVDLYGLRLTDTMKPTSVDGVAYTFRDFKVNGEAISGDANDMVHVLQLVDRNTKFAIDETVTLTYTVDIVNNGDDEVQVKLDNKAVADSWDARKVSTFALRTLSDEDNDPPAVSGSATSTVGGNSSSSQAGGTLPGKYTVTYSWTGLPENADETLPTGGKYPAGATVTVDTDYVEGRTVTIDKTTYEFSGWDKSGTFEMPKENVTISGSWKKIAVPATSLGETQALYLVQWLTEDGAVLKTEVRGPEKVGTEVSVTEADKTFEGYIFDEDADNVLAGILVKDAPVILKLYFKNEAPVDPDPVDPDPETVTVTWLNGYNNDPVKVKDNHEKGTEILASEYPEAPTRDGYTFAGWSDPETDVDGNITITARWTRNEAPSSPGTPSRPVVDPTPAPTEPETELPEEDVPLTELPEEDVPLAELPDEEVPLAEAPATEIPDEEVPLAEVPQTGEQMAAWYAVAALALAGYAALAVLSRKRKA